jgi:YidC/Oxa1 family membrane protein insertase
VDQRQQRDQQWRLLLAFGLSIMLWVGYQKLVLERYETPPPPPGEAATQENSSTPNTTLPPSPAATSPAKASGEVAAVPDGANVVVDTDVTRATITTRGGRLLALELKAYPQTNEPGSAPLNLVATGDILPLAVELTDGQSDAAVQYSADVTTLQTTGSERRDVVLRGTLTDGRAIEKRFTFQGDHYEFEVEVKVTGGKAAALTLPVQPPLDRTGVGYETAVSLQGPKYAYQALNKIPAEGLNRPGATWSGFATHYFLTALAPLSGPSDAAYHLVDKDLPVMRQSAAGDGGSFVVYAGPKDEASLERAGHQLSRALDFGYFWFAAVPLLHALRFLNRVFGNYGVAIILLTTGVKILTIPLTQTSFRNMRAMQKLQPEMTKLREKFKDDPTALQKEMMELYRRHRVNPLSGCVPMILQIPIFIGLYNSLSGAIELRHAPFALWIRDLSSPDRLMVAGVGIPVLTLLMGATMLVQQWLTPQQGDPTQQRVMMFMPLIFTFMFINLPSGLVLYWLVNNVLTITQQYWMLRTSK